MKNIWRGLMAVCLSGLILAVSPAVKSCPQGARDHLTPQETDLIRDAQELDRRTAVFIKAADRRLAALTGPAAPTPKQTPAETEKWGEIPKGTRAELLFDLARIIDEASNNIDDVSSRDPKNPLVLKALRKLAEASARFVAQLSSMKDQAQSEEEREALAQAIENAQAVIEAANKNPVPATLDKTDKKVKNRPSKQSN
jgi:hypothetical protein